MGALARSADTAGQAPEPLEFCLLGPLVVRRDGVALRIAAGKQRAVLAALLLHSERSVALEELAEVVWGAEPPPSARVTLHNYVMRLRAALGDAGRSRIFTRPCGYQITVRGGELDVARFEELQRRARQAARNGEWGQAAAHLAAALALWRGQPLSDVPSDLLARERPPLEEMRTQALEARIDADLRLGRHSEVIGELQHLAATHPLRERLHGMLMLALYRDGRQAEALDAYQLARRELVADLGLEPGHALRDLHRRILAADPDLQIPAAPPSRQHAATTARTADAPDATAPGTTPAAAAPPAGTAAPADNGHQLAGAGWRPPAAVVPRQLPAAVRHFAGRHTELKILYGLADEAATEPQAVVISAIGGTAGVGKTTLAVYFAHQVADRFGDGQLYVNLRGFGPSGAPLQAADAVRGFLEALHVPADQIPASADAQAQYRSLLAGKRMLIVADNARDTAHIRPLLPGSPGCLVLVTSRNQLTSLISERNAYPITLGLLTDTDARELLTGRLGATRIASEAQAADRLIRLCARLPLALSIAAGRAATHPDFPLEALAAELRDTRGRLDVLDVDEPPSGIRAVFSWSYRKLAAPAASMFRLLAIHPGPDITVPAAASMAGIAPGQALRELKQLTAAHLLSEHAPARYTFHDLLRTYAAEQQTGDGEPRRREAISRVFDHYLQTAHAADRLLYPARAPITIAAPRRGIVRTPLANDAQAFAWFEAEHQVLLAMVNLVAGNGLPAWRLAWAMETFLYRRAHWHDWAAVQATALAAARRMADVDGQASAHRGIGCASIELGACDDARHHLGEALRLRKEAGNVRGQARLLLDIARMCDRQGRHTEGLRCDQEALEIFRTAGDRSGEADALNALGWDLCQVGDYGQAVACCERALELHAQLGNRHNECATWDSLGYAHRCLRHYAEAADCYRRAVAIMDDLGHTYHKARTLAHAGDAHHAAGDAAAARQAWQQALDILEDMQHPDAAQARAKLRDLIAAP